MNTNIQLGQRLWAEVLIPKVTYTAAPLLILVPYCELCTSTKCESSTVLLLLFNSKHHLSQINAVATIQIQPLALGIQLVS